MLRNFTQSITKSVSILIVALILAGFGAGVFAQGKLSALQLLKDREAETEWDSLSLLKGDFDYDGVTDYALSGKRGGKFVVGIVKGTLKSDSKHWTLEFGEDGISQGSLSSVAEARIRLEKFSPNDEIPELKNLPKKSRGINLADDGSDAFHIYYSREKKQFVWWRN